MEARKRIGERWKPEMAEMMKGASEPMVFKVGKAYLINQGGTAGDKALVPVYGQGRALFFV